MTDWNQVGKDSADKTDAELAEGLTKLCKRDISGLFPDPADKTKVEGLIKKINAISSHNERVVAFKAVAAALTATGLSALKKAMLPLLLALVAGVGMARAQEPLIAIDMGAPLADARAGLAWDTNGTQLGVAYVPLIYVCPGAVEWATFNLGVADKLRTGKASYLVSFGPRIDTLFVKLGATAWAKKNLKFAILPPLQINLNFLTMDFSKYTPMISLSTRIGGR